MVFEPGMTCVHPEPNFLPIAAIIKYLIEYLLQP